MSNAGDKAKQVLTGAAALGALVTTEVNTAHGEVDKFTVAGVPLFWRSGALGTPRLLGIPFPRWIRGPRDLSKGQP
jgi:hypothetical protein